jgi:zinc protease
MRRSGVRSLFAVLVILGASGCAATGLESKPSSPYKPVNFRGAYEPYPSGMRLLVHEDPNTRQVTLDVSYRAGAADEPVGKEGLAALARRLTFLARHGQPQAPQLRSRILSLGAESGASHTYDATDYWLAAPVERFASLVSLEAQRMREPLANITEADFIAERDRLVAELREDPVFNPRSVGMRWMHELLLAGHPYGHAVQGTPESVQRLSLEEVRAFVKEHYTPARAVLVVSGPMTVADVKYEVARGFAGLTGMTSSERTPPVDQSFLAPPRVKPAGSFPGVVKRAAVAHPQLWMVWQLPGLRPGKNIQPRILAGIFDSWLSGELYEPQGVLPTQVFNDNLRQLHVLTGESFVQELSGVTLVGVVLTLGPDADAKAVAERVWRGLGFVHSTSRFGGDSRGRLALAYLDLYKELEQVPTSEMARYLRLTGQVNFLSARQQQIQTSFEELDEYVFEYVQKGDTWTMLLVPEQDGAVHPLPGVFLQERARLESLRLAPSTFDVRRLAPPPGAPPAAEFTLSNGLKVVALRRDSYPLVDAALSLRVAAPTNTEEAASVLAPLARWRDGYFPAWGRMSGRTQANQAALRAWAVSVNVQPMLDTFREVLEKPVLWFDDGERVLRMKRAASQPEWRALQELKARLFPGHFYGTFLDPETLPSLTLQQQREWHAAHVRPEATTLLLVGDLPPSPELRQRVEELLGRWRPEGGSAPLQASVQEAAVPSARSVTVVDTPGKPHASIFVGLRWPLLTAGQEAAADMLDPLLEDRLGQRLREAGSPGVLTFYEQRPLAASLTLHTVVDTKKVTWGLEQILAELSQLEEVPLPSEAVEQARWLVAREYPARFRTSAEVVRQWELLMQRGRALDHWEKYPEQLGAVTPEALQRLVGALNLGSEVVVITGDAATLKPELVKAGFQVEVLAAPSTVAR